MKMKIFSLSIVILIIGLLVCMNKDVVQAQYCAWGTNPNTNQGVLWKGDCSSMDNFCSGGCALSPQKYYGNVVILGEENTDQCDKFSFSCDKLLKMLWTSDSKYGSYMMSPNLKYTAEFQVDCNLVIYDYQRGRQDNWRKNVNYAIWGAGTDKLELQSFFLSDLGFGGYSYKKGDIYYIYKFPESEKNWYDKYLLILCDNGNLILKARQRWQEWQVKWMSHPNEKQC